MLDLRFKNFRRLLCMAKLALIEAEAHSPDVRLVLAHDPRARLWGLSLEGLATPALQYEMMFTILLDDLKIPDEDTYQAAFLKRLSGIGTSLTVSMVALTELRHTPLLAIDPACPPPVPEFFSHQTLRIE